MMSFTATITEKIVIGTTGIELISQYTDEAELQIDRAIPDSETDFEIALTLTVAQIAVVFISCDQDVLLEFNNSTTGEPEISLLANKPYIWKKTDSYFANLLNTNITILYVTNTSGSVANFKFRTVYDVTA